jgi:hypothetical protein
VSVFENRTVNPASTDCNQNGRPDECDIEDGSSADCNGNGLPDVCDLRLEPASDCNRNGVPDSCDLEGGTSLDSDGNGIPDECQHVYFHRGDANGDGWVDVSDSIAIAVTLFANGEARSCREAVDVDNDGEIAVTDAIFLAGYLFLGTTEPPPPGVPPNPCGGDPDPPRSAGDLGCTRYQHCR